MTDNPGNLEKQFEALTNSTNHLNNLRLQLEETEKRHAFLVKELLDAIEGNPSQVKFEIIQQKRTIAEGPLNKQMLGIFRAFGGSLTNTPHGEGAGCPEKAGCANIGQRGNNLLVPVQDSTVFR